jgi:thiamine biosynthesis protein ThiS
MLPHARSSTPLNAHHDVVSVTLDRVLEKACGDVRLCWLDLRPAITIGFGKRSDRRDYVRIKVNGEDRQVTERITLAELVAELGFRPETLAVERNLQMAPKREYANIVLQEGDALEIVTLVGGG